MSAFGLLLLALPCAAALRAPVPPATALRAAPQQLVAPAAVAVPTVATAAVARTAVAVMAERAAADRRPLLAQPKLRTLAKAGAALLALSLCAPSLALAATAAGEHLHTGQKVALFFQKSGLPNWAVLMLISATPAIELRGGVPVGNWMGISPATTFLICAVGNMAPIAPMLLALRSAFFKKLAAPLLARAEKKLAGLPTGQSRTLALALFVGIPAPGTGAWTGAIIAYLLDMDFATAMGSIFAGVVVAGAIMTTLTLAGKAGALVALAALLAAGAGAIMSSLSKEGGDDAPPVAA